MEKEPFEIPGIHKNQVAVERNKQRIVNDKNEEAEKNILPIVKGRGISDLLKIKTEQIKNLKDEIFKKFK